MSYIHPGIVEEKDREIEALRMLVVRYEELLMAVQKKHPGESRHQTALRYIKEREYWCGGPGTEKEA